jgi:hypothetical protein
VSAITVNLSGGTKLFTQVYASSQVNAPVTTWIS